MFEVEGYKQHWFDKKIPRTYITIILTASAAVCGGLITRFSGPMLTILFIFFTIVFVAMQILFSIRCATFDKVRELSVTEMEEKIKVYKKLFEGMPQLLDPQSEGINKIAKDIMSSGIVPGDRWTFDDASTRVCGSIAQFLKEYRGTPINVYYIKAVDNAVTKVKMVGVYDDCGDVPGSYMIERAVKEDNDGHFDIKMFEKNSLRAEYRFNLSDVDDAYNRDKGTGDIEQFLFIPVTCDKRKMIGLIEILVPKGHIIAKNEDEMKNIQKLLKIYSSIFVLLQKAEKAAIALPQK